MVTAAIPVAALLSKSAQAVESSNDNCVLAFDTLTAALNSTTLSNGDILFIHNMGTLSSSAIGGNGGTYFKVIPYPSSESLDIRRSIAMPSFSIQLISNDVIKVSDLAISAEGFERAREMLITGHDEFTGGVVEIPVGRNFINSEINIPIDGVNDFINTTYKGASKEASALDFSNAGILDNGIAFEGGPFYALRDMAIFRAPQSGVLQTKSPTVWNHVCLADMRITANKQHGINAERGFLGTYARVFSSGNSIHGFNMQGLHTSLSFDNCYAASNSAVGYKLNEITYSSMHSCAADSNGWHGYEISKSHTLAINGCGSENNGKSGFSLQSSLVLGENKNISLNSVFAFTNNTANEGSANLLHMKSLDGGKNTATLANSHSRSPANPIEDIIVDVEGSYLVEGYNELPNGVKSKNKGYIQHLPKHTVVRDLFVPLKANLPKDVNNAPIPVPVCSLMSPQGYSTTYSGELLIQVTNSDPSDHRDKNVAIYKVLVCKTAPATPFCELILSTGRTNGAGASFPSFTWNINSNDQLAVTPINNTGNRSFFFEVLATGFVKSIDL